MLSLWCVIHWLVAVLFWPYLWIDCSRKRSYVGCASKIRSTWFFFPAGTMSSVGKFLYPSAADYLLYLILPRRIAFLESLVFCTKMMRHCLLESNTLEQGYGTSSVWNNRNQSSDFSQPVPCHFTDDPPLFSGFHRIYNTESVFAAHAVRSARGALFAERQYKSGCLYMMYSFWLFACDR